MAPQLPQQLPVALFPHYTAQPQPRTHLQGHGQPRREAAAFDPHFVCLHMLQVARLLDGVNIIGADLVEVSPPFDQSGGTAFLGVSIMFEILCNLAGNIASR